MFGEPCSEGSNRYSILVCQYSQNATVSAFCFVLFLVIKEKSKGLGFGFYAPLEFCQSEIAMTLRPNQQVSPDQRTGSNLGRKQPAERWPVFSKVPRLFTNTHGLLTIPPQSGTVPAIRKGVSESWGKG